VVSVFISKVRIKIFTADWDTEFNSWVSS
jgi:hypothetical protein